MREFQAIHELDVSFTAGGDLNDRERLFRDRSKLMKAMDQLNTRYGRGTLQVAAMGQQNQLQAWQMRQERRTPHYTTDWRQIPIARA